MQNEDRQEISDTLKLLIHNNTKCQDMSGKKIYGRVIAGGAANHGVTKY